MAYISLHVHSTVDQYVNILGGRSLVRRFINITKIAGNNSLSRQSRIVNISQVFLLENSGSYNNFNDPILSVLSWGNTINRKLNYVSHDWLRKDFTNLYKKFLIFSLETEVVHLNVVCVYTNSAIQVLSLNRKQLHKLNNYDKVQTVCER